MVSTDVPGAGREDDVTKPENPQTLTQETPTMDFTTISALTSDRQTSLRRDGELVRQGRIARLRRTASRPRDRSPADTR